MPLKCHRCSINARCSKSSLNHFIRFCAIFPRLKHNFIAYRSSKVSSHPDCIFAIHQLWQSGFSRVYSNFCSSRSFVPEIIKTGQSSHKMYSNNILNFQGSRTILNVCSKKVWKLIDAPRYRNINATILNTRWRKSTICSGHPRRLRDTRTSVKTGVKKSAGIIKENIKTVKYLDLAREIKK